MKENDVREFMSAEAQKTHGASVGIPARQMSFPLPEGRSKFPFFGENPLASSLFAVFSGIFPPGERFFIRSVRRFRDRITDPTLRARISGFSGQEAMHGREHERLNAWFAAQGYDMAMPDRTIRASLGLLAKLPPTQQIACTNFMEHFTAHLAEQWLTHDEFRLTSDPEVLKLWTWHALEELEHKAVAFDVHAEVSEQAYRERVLAAPLVLAALLPGIAFSWAFVLAKHGEAFRFDEHRRGLVALFGEGGFVRKVVEQLPSYFARDFHPSHEDTTELERTWRDALFGDRGELNAYLRNRETLARAARAELPPTPVSRDVSSNRNN